MTLIWFIFTQQKYQWNQKWHPLAPGKFEWNFRYVIFKWIWMVDGWGTSCEIALIWMSLDFTDDQSTSHYLNQCWPRSPSPFGYTMQQWVKLQDCNQFYLWPIDCGMLLLFPQTQHRLRCVCTCFITQGLQMLLVCDHLIAHQLLWQNMGASVSIFQESPLAEEPRERLIHIHSVHRYQLCTKIFTRLRYCEK